MNVSFTGIFCLKSIVGQQKYAMVWPLHKLATNMHCSFLKLFTVVIPNVYIAIQHVVNYLSHNIVYVNPR